jgi:hypothetical protein
MDRIRIELFRIDGEPRMVKLACGNAFLFFIS